MMEYVKYLGYAGIAMFILYVLLRLAERRVVSRIVQDEVDKVVNDKEYKVKGRFE